MAHLYPKASTSSVRRDPRTGREPYTGWSNDPDAYLMKHVPLGGSVAEYPEDDGYRGGAILDPTGVEDPQIPFGDPFSPYLYDLPALDVDLPSLLDVGGISVDMSGITPGNLLPPANTTDLSVAVTNNTWNQGGDVDVDEDDIIDAIGSAKGGGWDLVAEIKVHFKGDQSVSGYEVDANDWRDRGVQVWMWPSDVDDEFNTALEMSQNDNKDGGLLSTLRVANTVIHTSSDEDTYLISGASHALGHLYISANDDGTGDFVEAELYVDISDSGKLKMDFTHTDPGDEECEGFFIVWLWGTKKTSSATALTPGNGH
jgi:hypothetical protein